MHNAVLLSRTTNGVELHLVVCPPLAGPRHTRSRPQLQDGFASTTRVCRRHNDDGGEVSIHVLPWRAAAAVVRRVTSEFTGNVSPELVQLVPLRLCAGRAAVVGNDDSGYRTTPRNVIIMSVNCSNELMLCINCEPTLNNAFCILSSQPFNRSAPLGCT